MVCATPPRAQDSPGLLFPVHIHNDDSTNKPFLAKEVTEQRRQTTALSPTDHSWLRSVWLREYSEASYATGDHWRASEAGEAEDAEVQKCLFNAGRRSRSTFLECTTSTTPSCVKTHENKMPEPTKQLAQALQDALGRTQSPDAAAWSSGTATGTTSSADATGDTPQSQGVGRGVVTASCIFPATPENFNGDDADWREQSRFFRSWVARFCKSRVHAKLETVAQHRDNRTHVLDLFAAHAKTTRMICLNSQRSHTMSWSRSCAERTRSSS